MNKKWVEFLLENAHEGQTGQTEYTVCADQLLDFIIENDLLK